MPSISNKILVQSFILSAKLANIASELSDGTKITDSIPACVPQVGRFDSLKFSKQATKRSLRENIRESVEKMGEVISVFLPGLKNSTTLRIIS